MSENPLANEFRQFLSQMGYCPEIWFTDGKYESPLVTSVDDYVDRFKMPLNFIAKKIGVKVSVAVEARTDERSVHYIATYRKYVLENRTMPRLAFAGDACFWEKFIQEKTAAWKKKLSILKLIYG